MPRYNQQREQFQDIRQESWNKLHGVVTKVHEHDGQEDRLSNHEVNVQLKNRGGEFKRVSVHTDHEGSIYVPQKGDTVEVEFLQSQTQRPVVTGVAYTNVDRAPLAREGHFRREFENESKNTNLYLESEPVTHESIERDSEIEPDTVRMAVKEDGLADPVARIEIDLSGSDPVIRLTRGEDEQGNTDMGLELDFGDGSFKIGDGSGYGIVSDGNGKFTWYNDTIDFVDDGSTIDW